MSPPVTGTAPVLDLACTAVTEVTLQAGTGRLGGLRRLVLGTRWWLHRDGRLLMVPAPGTARDDVFPMPGRWWEDGGATLLSAGSANDSGGRVDVTAQLTAGPDGGIGLRMEEAVRSASGLRRTVLLARLVAVVPGTAGTLDQVVGGVHVPAVYRVSVRGTSGGQDFGPLPGELTVLPAVDGWPDPVEITLATDLGDLPVLGDLAWFVSADGLTRWDTGRYRLTLAEGVLRCAVDGEDDVAAVTWSAPTSSRVPLGALPVTASTARLELRFDGDTVRGELESTGWSIGGDVTYRAQIQGHVAARGVPDAVGSFDGVWQVAAARHGGTGA